MTKYDMEFFADGSGGLEYRLAIVQIIEPWGVSWVHYRTQAWNNNFQQQVTPFLLLLFLCSRGAIRTAMPSGETAFSEAEWHLHVKNKKITWWLWNENCRVATRLNYNSGKHNWQASHVLCLFQKLCFLQEAISVSWLDDFFLHVIEKNNIYIKKKTPEYQVHKHAYLQK